MTNQQRNILTARHSPKTDDFDTYSSQRFFWFQLRKNWSIINATINVILMILELNDHSWRILKTNCGVNDWPFFFRFAKVWKEAYVWRYDILKEFVPKTSVFRERRTAAARPVKN